MREKMDDQGRDIKECRKLAETHSLLAGQLKKLQEQERELNQRCIRNEGENARLREQPQSGYSGNSEPCRRTKTAQMSCWPHREMTFRICRNEMKVSESVSFLSDAV